MGELTSLESAKITPQPATSAPATTATAVKPEFRSSITAKPVGAAAAAAVTESVDGAAAGSTSTADQSSAAVKGKEVPSLMLENPRQLNHSLSEANLKALSSKSLDSTPRRQLTSVHSMQSEAAHDGSKKRGIKHSLSGRITPSGGSATSGGYSSRYATRQLSGRASPIPSESASSGRRSLVTSPTASLHGGQAPIQQQSPGKFGSGRAATAVGADEQPGATLAGAAAALSVRSHSKPSSSEGLGWHLATVDGLPFSPRGSLVASSGGSRTLRPIASQQEALFDAEGNTLPRNELPGQQTDILRSDLAGSASATVPQPSNEAAAESAKIKGKLQTKLGAKQDIQAEPSTNRDLIGAALADHDAHPTKQKPKHGMLSVVMFPCFCLRPRTTSAEDPYSHGSLRQRYAAKEESSPEQLKAISGKAMPTPKSALKQKQTNSALVTEASNAGWDLGTHVHQAEADALGPEGIPQLNEAADEEDEGQKGRSLQGAISLAPKRGGLADAKGMRDPLREV